MTRQPPPFDAVLLISFGGPQGMADIRPFLANVLRGRNVPESRVDQVAEHYELFGGVSPITRLTLQQADGLAQRLRSSAAPLPVHVGMRNWHPFLAETLSEMSRAGVRRAVGFIMAPHASYSSCQQYRENVAAAKAELRAAGCADVAVTYVPGWYEHEGFIAANAGRVRKAIERLPARGRSSPRLIFTAHSIPTAMAERSRYREQLLASARLVAERIGLSDWMVAYQSRSGRPTDPWLEPDVSDALRTAKSEGHEAAVLCPIGFVCDHIEVIYDLDREAAGVAREIGLTLTRSDAVNDDPAFLDMMADVVQATVKRYASGRPLPLEKGVGSI
jgi:protoporphyrin/coproporphyrin ferrochelatase